MGAVEDFSKAVELLREKDKEFQHEPGYQEEYNFIKTGASQAEQYMQDMNNWCFVHVTRYMPPRNSKGQMFIPTTSMATGFDLVRPTVHGTLNHIVASNNGGNWDNVPYVFFMKYDDVVKLNGNPQGISQYDTFFMPDPDRGLVLPKNAYLVRPSDEKSDELYTIGENEATYKTENFTDDEIERILDLIRKGRNEAIYHALYQEYDSYMGKENDDNIMSALLKNDEKLMKVYRNSSNKKEFLKGLLAADRDAIIARFLREFVVKLAMEKQGFKYVNAYEGEGWTNAVYQTAREHGIEASSGAKIHEASLERKMEDRANYLIFCLEEQMYSEGTNIDNIFETLRNNLQNYDNDYAPDKARKKMFRQVMQCITKNKPLDIYPMMQEAFVHFVDVYEYKCGDGSIPEKISDYSLAMDTTLRRSAIVVKNKFAQWINYLKRESAYEQLRSKITEFLSQFDQRSLMGVFKADIARAGSNR
ncbi:MAG: hypothetical protein J5742_00785 [Alphaproteobacteria bacterium]|nr:hypothetical protein [Alphaproteobacteria bacterium]